jgi:hypothetical protein
VARQLRISSTLSASATDVRFGGNLDAALRRRALSAALEYRVADEWTLSLAGGASLGGDLRVQDVRHALGPGPLASLAASYRILDGRDRFLPFLLFGIAGSVSTVVTEADRDPGARARMTALDFRAALTAGKVFLDALAPYLVLRGFGGPIFWKLAGADVTGSDRYHFQLGGGALVTAGVFDAFVEVVPLGERAATVGAAVSF